MITLPSVHTMSQSLVKNGGFELTLKDMGQDYALTLNKWAENFTIIDKVEKMPKPLSENGTTI